MTCFDRNTQKGQNCMAAVLSFFLYSFRGSPGKSRLTVSHFRGGVTRYFRPARSSIAMSTGLDRCSSIPASLLFSMSSVKAFAVMARMGIVLPSGFLPLRMGAQILIGSWTPLDTEAPALPDAEPPPQAVRAADAASRPCNAFATQRKPRRPAAFAAYRRDLYRIAKIQICASGTALPANHAAPAQRTSFPEAAYFKRTFRTSCLCPA